MLDEAPHILQVRTIIPPDDDEYGRPIPGTGGERWDNLTGGTLFDADGDIVLDADGEVVSDASDDGEVTECFCHDNSQQKEISVNGKLWVYAYHVVYEGKKIALDTMIRCKDKETQEVVGEGKVIKNAECYSEELKGRCDIWL